ncbi:MAG: aldo/keto reductase, partial [Burkholderiaceae bacterium]
MQYVRFGNTGLKVSRICLGMMTYGTPQWRPWVLDEAAALPVVKHAVDAGINFFDTADMYSAGESEALTGRFLKMLCRREEVVLATKLYYPVEMAFKGGNSG